MLRIIVLLCILLPLLIVMAFVMPMLIVIPLTDIPFEGLLGALT